MNTFNENTSSEAPPVSPARAVHPELVHPCIPPIDFAWNNAALIAPQHVSGQHVSGRGGTGQAAYSETVFWFTTHRFLVCPGLETIKGAPLTLEEHHALATTDKIQD